MNFCSFSVKIFSVPEHLFDQSYHLNYPQKNESVYLFSILLTHSAGEYFEKVAFKKNKKRNFKRLYLKSQGQFRVQTNIFRNFIQFSSKQSSFLHALLTRVHVRGFRLLQPPVSLPAARRAQRVNDQTVKVLNLLFFVYFI